MPNKKISQLTAYPNSTFASTDIFEVSYLTGGIYYSRYLTGTQILATINAETELNDLSDVTITAVASGDFIKWNGSAYVNAKLPCEIQLAASDETTALTTGTAKITFRMPYAMTLTGVRASLTTAGTTSGVTTIDINEGGVSLLSTLLTIDFDEKTSTTAATPVVISDSALADDSEITIDVDGLSTGATEAGLKITLIGTRA